MSSTLPCAFGAHPVAPRAALHGPLLSFLASASSGSLPRAVLLAAAALTSTGVLAEDIHDSESALFQGVKAMQPYASVTVTRESNLLLLSDGEKSAIKSSRGSVSDEYVTSEVGFSGNIRKSRQELLLEGRIYNNKYNEFDEYDHNGGEAKARLNWMAGNLWDGQAGYVYRHKLRDFANQDLPIRDMIDRHKVHASARRALTPRWKAGGELALVDVSASKQTALDKLEYQGGVDATYYSESGNSAGVEAKYSSGDFKESNARNYQEWSIGPAADWRLTPKTRAQASAGYKRLSINELDGADFAGLVAGVDLDWEVTPKTSVNVVASRDISRFNDEIANYAIVDEFSVAPAWSVTPKTSVRAFGLYQRVDYQSGDVVSPGVVERKDDVVAVGIGLDWAFTRNSLVTFEYRNETRDSTRSVEEYANDVVQLGVRLGL